MPLYWVEYRKEFGACIRADSEKEAMRIFMREAEPKHEIVLVLMGQLHECFCEITLIPEGEEDECIDFQSGV